MPENIQTLESLEATVINILPFPPSLSLPSSLPFSSPVRSPALAFWTGEERLAGAGDKIARQPAAYRWTEPHEARKQREPCIYTTDRERSAAWRHFRRSTLLGDARWRGEFSKLRRYFLVKVKIIERRSTTNLLKIKICFTNFLEAARTNTPWTMED